MKRNNMTVAATAVVALLLLLTLGAPQASADSFTFTSCHLTGGCGTATSFGTVTLTQVGTSVRFDVVLTSGNTFVETGASNKNLFLFHDTISGSTVTNVSATFNGATVTIKGGLKGLTNQKPFKADGTGFFTAIVFCKMFKSCNGASGPSINDLHFTVTNATLAQLETKNKKGNIFVADILCGQPGCTGKTGLVDANMKSVPDGGLTLILLGGALVGLESLRRRLRV